MAIKAPTIIRPWGQGANITTHSFQFPSDSDAPTSWRAQWSESRTMSPLFHETVSAAWFTNPRRVDLTTAAMPKTFVTGRIYWWRARGEAPTVGPWSYVRFFSPDPTAGGGPYDDWARALLALSGYPRPSNVLGTLLPVGPEVAQLLALPWASRVTIRTANASGVGTADRLAEVVGLSVHLDAISGWEVNAVTKDVP